MSDRRRVPTECETADVIKHVDELTAEMRRLSEQSSKLHTQRPPLASRNAVLKSEHSACICVAMCIHTNLRD